MMSEIIPINKDIAEMDTVEMKEIAKILGLKYHTARNKILKSGLGFIDYDGKRVWLREDIYEYKRSHYIGA